MLRFEGSVSSDTFSYPINILILEYYMPLITSNINDLNIINIFI